jgi:hypothetical protein
MAPAFVPAHAADAAPPEAKAPLESKRPDPEPHPLFSPAPDGKGAARILRLEGRGMPRNLLLSPQGHLFWQQGADPEFHGLGAKGERFVTPLPGNATLSAMTLASDNRLWCFGDQVISCFDADHATGEAEASTPSPGFTVHHAAPGTDGKVWTADGVGVHVFRLRPEGGKIDGAPFPESKGGAGEPAAPDTVPARRVIPCEPCGQVFTVEAERNYLRIQRFPDGNRLSDFTMLDTPPEALSARPGHRLFLGMDGRILEFDARIQSCYVRGIPDTPGGRLQPGQVAEGADGALWFTVPGQDRIGRLDERDGLQWFPLPKDSRPTEIVSSPAGWMLFTLPGSNALGALPAPPRGPAVR